LSFGQRCSFLDSRIGWRATGDADQSDRREEFMLFAGTMIAPGIAVGPAAVWAGAIQAKGANHVETRE
jgi:hypothetical protein